MVLYADVEFIGTCVYAGVSRSFIVISHRLIIEYTNRMRTKLRIHVRIYVCTCVSCWLVYNVI